MAPSVDPKIARMMAQAGIEAANYRPDRARPQNLRIEGKVRDNKFRFRSAFCVVAIIF